MQQKTLAASSSSTVQNLKIYTSFYLTVCQDCPQSRLDVGTICCTLPFYYLIENMSLVWVLASVLSSLMFTRTWSTSRSMPKSVLQRCCNCSRSPHELKQEELSNELPLLLVFSSNTFLFLAAHYSSLPNNEEAVVPDPTQCSCIPRSGVCLMFLDNI